MAESRSKKSDESAGGVNKPSGDVVVHEIDGIQELDNNLPNWWLATFFLTIVFGIGYYYYYEVFDGEPLGHAYRRELAERLEASGQGAQVTAAMLEDLSQDAAKMSEAAALFTSTCASCHGPNGGGTVGPNLTDDFWMHGGSPEQIYTSIHDGYPTKGMPEWGKQLGEAKIPMLTAYLMTLRGTNVAGGKAPQGDKYP